ncbi:sugar phosphate isomerase/epimerase [Fulvivirga sp. M361]|uniref:sugar phosphate isomerase/epimerase family protein n=1 Tax=Fulvivirga sp. M361 TaxID=2594266 RepID=UPI00117AA5E4|nr:sugar phosphate isomerase/epimerase family protein [Fulvivirga sp. M361]TRX61415.1 sugar phosphate isomerase/epimerase [Fulvivirga sp. M361]
MKRRTFNKNAIVTGLGVGLTGLKGCTSSNKKSEAQTVDDMPFFKLSLAQWSIHKMIREEGLDPYAFADKAKKWGFAGLEYVSQLYQDGLQKSSSISVGLQQMVKQLKVRSDDNGLENLIMMVDLPPGEGDMAVLDETLRKKAIENHFPYVEATAALGCHSMRVNMFGELDPGNWKSTAVDALGELGEYAASGNVNILIENHGYLSSNAPLLMEVINEVNLPNCGTLPDFGNFCLKRADDQRWGTACIEEYDKYKGVEELMPAAKAVSAKSYDFDADGNETSIDYQRMLKIVKNAGYTGYIGVEYEGNRLSEEKGIIATKELLVNIGKTLA